MRLKTIDTRHGTLNTPNFSNGNTLPYTGVPFGMNYFIHQNQTGANWHFDPTLPIFQGIRLTHQPSPWMGDFSSVLFTPVTGNELKPNVEANQSSYKIDQAVFQPHYYKVDLLRYRLSTVLTPTIRGAKIKITNNGNKVPGFVLHTEEKVQFTINKKEKQITGELKQPVNSGQSTLSFYFVIDLNEETIEDFTVGLFNNDFLEEAGEESFETDYLYVKILSESKSFELSINSSFINNEQAVLNLQQEILGYTFAQLQEKAANTWEYYLNTIEVEDRDLEKVRDFNQYMYRMFLFPQIFYEVNDKNEPIHYDVYSESVKPGKFFTNNGYWDTYKTVYPLFSLIIPDKYKEILEGIANFYKNSGHLPKWLSPDERGLMPGTLVNAVIADAAVKGLLEKDELQFFLDAMIKEATVEPNDTKFGRSGVKDTLDYGYVTNEKIESVNQTQDNAYSDFCIRQVANLLEKDEIVEKFENEALNYRNIFDADSGFMRGKDKDGIFTKDFTQEDWAFDYAEGSAWQNSLSVFHNFADYIDMYGGVEPFFNHLVDLANEDPIFGIGNYGTEIHEMSEMAVVDFGQIAISNQPSFHIPYMYSYVGKPEYTQLVVKQLCTEAFTTEYDGYPGDEDNGSLSGWYIFSMLGFYPVTPGTNEYVLGIPQFEKSKIHLPGEKEFIILTDNVVPQYNFVKNMQMNGKNHSKLYIEHENIIQGGEMEVELSLLPPNKTYEVEELPYSMRNEIDRR